MKNIYAILTLSLLLLLSSCYTTKFVSGNLLMSVQQGMTPTEVRTVFGSEPDFRRFDGGFEEWEYKRYSKSGGGAWAIILIQFTDGRVSGMDSFNERGIELNSATIVSPSPTALTTVDDYPFRLNKEQVEVISDKEYDRLLNKVKFTVLGDEQKKLIEHALKQHDFTSAQCSELVKQISYTPDRIDIMKKMYPCVADKQNFRMVIEETLSYNGHKEEMRRFVRDYNAKNKR